MMPRILILTDPNEAYSYRPRTRYLCDYLHKVGYSIRQIDGIIVNENTPEDWYQAFLQRIVSVVSDKRHQTYTDEVLQQIEGEDFDCVLCASSTPIYLSTALEIAKKRHIKLVVDIRNLEEQIPQLHHIKQRHQRDMVLSESDCVITTTPWHRAFIRNLNSKVHLIWDGYDPSLFYPENVKTDKFIIGYFGQVYRFQHPELIEYIVHEIGKPDIELAWHTPEYNTLTPEQIPDKMRQCAILLSLTDSKAHGFIPNQFYEALGCEKPVLCVPSDQGLLAEVINATNAGLASSDRDEIKAFILNKYEEWKRQGYTRQTVINKEQFSRETQTKQMEHILSRLCRE